MISNDAIIPFWKMVIKKMSDCLMKSILCSQKWVIHGVPILTGRKRTLRDFNHVEALCLLTFSLKSFNFIDGKNTP